MSRARASAARLRAAAAASSGERHTTTLSKPSEVRGATIHDEMRRTICCSSRADFEPESTCPSCVARRSTRRRATCSGTSRKTATREAGLAPPKLSQCARWSGSKLQRSIRTWRRCLSASRAARMHCLREPRTSWEMRDQRSLLLPPPSALQLCARSSCSAKVLLPAPGIPTMTTSKPGTAVDSVGKAPDVPANCPLSPSTHAHARECGGRCVRGARCTQCAGVCSDR